MALSSRKLIFNTACSKLFFPIQDRNNHFLVICATILYYRPQKKFAKVMFLHLSVSHSVHRGVSASVHAGIPPLGSRHPPEQTPSSSRHPPGADPPPGAETATAADGTHPTGMHSCFTYFYNI